MGLERPLVFGLDHARRGLERVIDVAGLLTLDRPLAHRRVADVVIERGLIGNGGAAFDHSTLS